MAVRPQPVRARRRARRSVCPQRKPKPAVRRWPWLAHVRPRKANALPLTRRAASRKMRAAARSAKKPNVPSAKRLRLRPRPPNRQSLHPRPQPNRLRRHPMHRLPQRKLRLNRLPRLPSATPVHPACVSLPAVQVSRRVRHGWNAQAMPVRKANAVPTPISSQVPQAPGQAHPAHVLRARQPVRLANAARLAPAWRRSAMCHPQVPTRPMAARSAPARRLRVRRPKPNSKTPAAPRALPRNVRPAALARTPMRVAA
jgi:hypothetical protein